MSSCPKGMTYVSMKQVQYEYKDGKMHSTKLGFCADSGPVTNGQYDKFIEGQYKKQKKSGNFDDFKKKYIGKSGKRTSKQPVRYVYFQGAKEYCTSLKKRLPREEELTRTVEGRKPAFVTNLEFKDKPFENGYLWFVESIGGNRLRMGIQEKGSNLLLTTHDDGSSYADTSFFCVKDAKK